MLKNKYLGGFVGCLFNSKFSIYIILIITAILVLPNIGRESLWLDEIFSATVTLKSSSLNSMFSNYILKDGNPPLYYLLLYYWGRIFGTSDFIIRLLSYGATLIGLVFSYLLLLKYLNRRIAILFLSLSSFTPCVLYYAQEARMYSILYALSSLASIIFFIFLLRIKNEQKIDKIIIIYYFIIGVLICYTHHFGSLIIFSLSLIAIIYSLLLKQKVSAATIFLISFSIGSIGVIWLLIQFYYVNMANHIQEVSWTKNDFKSIILNYSTLFALNKFGVAILLVFFIPFMINFSFFVKIIKKHIILLFPVLVLFLIAFMIGSKMFIISERYFIVTIPLILLFISLIFNEMFIERKGYIFLYLILLLSISIYKNFTYQKQNWRDASKFIENNINSNCEIPIKGLSDGSFDKLMFVSYYLGPKFNYLPSGPKVQNNCNLIYIDGHTNEEGIRKTLLKYNISTPYEIIEFNKVYVVIKKRNLFLNYNF